MEDSNDRADFITHLIDGNNAMVRGDIDAAIAAYHLALVLNPKFAMTCAKLGQAYYKKKDYDEAIKYYKMALELDPKQTETLYRLVKAYGDSGMMIQAAVAFDLARERDKEGDLSERIESTERRIKRSSSHGAVRKVSGPVVLRDVVKILFNHPTVVIPVLLSTAIFAGSGLFARWAATLLFHKAPMTDFTVYLTTNSPGLNLSTVAYYAFQVLVVYALICAPLLGVEMALVGRLSGGKEAVFDEALSRSFGQISSLAAITLLIVCVLGMSAYILNYVFMSISIMLRDFFRIGVSLRVLIIPVSLALVVHFLFIYPAVIIDKKKMEGGFKKSFTLASRFFMFTYILLCLSIFIFVIASRFGGDISGITPKFIFSQLIIALDQSFFVAVLTIIYTSAQRPKHKSRKRSKIPPKEGSAEQITAQADQAPFPESEI